MSNRTIRGTRLLAALMALLILLTAMPFGALAQDAEPEVVLEEVLAQSEESSEAAAAPSEDAPAKAAKPKLTSLALSKTKLKNGQSVTATIKAKNAKAALVTVDGELYPAQEETTDAVRNELAKKVSSKKATIKLTLDGLSKGKHTLQAWLRDANGVWAAYGKGVKVSITNEPKAAAPVVEEEVVEIDEIEATEEPEAPKPVSEEEPEAEAAEAIIKEDESEFVAPVLEAEEVEFKSRSISGQYLDVVIDLLGNLSSTKVAEVAVSEYLPSGTSRAYYIEIDPVGEGVQVGKPSGTRSFTLTNGTGGWATISDTIEIEFTATREDYGKTGHYRANVYAHDSTDLVHSIDISVTVIDSVLAKAVVALDKSNVLINLGGQTTATAETVLTAANLPIGEYNVEFLPMDGSDDICAPSVARTLRVVSDGNDGTRHEGDGLVITLTGNRKDYGKQAQYRVRVYNDQYDLSFITNLTATVTDSRLLDSQIAMGTELGVPSGAFVVDLEGKTVNATDAKLWAIDLPVGTYTVAFDFLEGAAGVSAPSTGTTLHVSDTVSDSLWGTGIMDVTFTANRESYGQQARYRVTVKNANHEIVYTQDITVNVVDTALMEVTDQQASKMVNGRYTMLECEKMTLGFLFSNRDITFTAQKPVSIQEQDIASVSYTDSLSNSDGTYYVQATLTGVKPGEGRYTFSVDGYEYSFYLIVYPCVETENLFLDINNPMLLNLMKENREGEFLLTSDKDLSDYTIDWNYFSKPDIASFVNTHRTNYVNDTFIARSEGYGETTVTATVTPPVTSAMLINNGHSFYPHSRSIEGIIVVTDEGGAKIELTRAGTRDVTDMMEMFVGEKDYLSKEFSSDYRGRNYMDKTGYDLNMYYMFDGEMQVCTAESSFTFDSSNPKVVSVSNSGDILALTAGSSVITVTGTYLGTNTSHHVATYRFTINVTDPSLSLTPSRIKLYAGEDSALNYKASTQVSDYYAIGYRLETLFSPYTVENVSEADIYANMKWYPNEGQLKVSDKVPAGEYILTAYLYTTKDVNRIGPDISANPVILFDKYGNSNFSPVDLSAIGNDMYTALASYRCNITVLAKGSKVLVDDVAGLAKVNPVYAQAVKNAAAGESKMPDAELMYPKTLTMPNIGTSTKMVAVVRTDDNTVQKVTWSSADSKVATVDANGNVTAVGVGVTQIIATHVLDGSVYGIINVKVGGDLNTFYLVPDETFIKVGDKQLFVPNVYTAKDLAQGVQVTYTVKHRGEDDYAGNDIVTLKRYFDPAYGKWVCEVTGIASGTTTLTAYNPLLDQYSEAIINVRTGVVSLEAPNTHVVMVTGEKYRYNLYDTLIFNGNKDDLPDNQAVEYLNYDPSIIDIDEDGIILAKKVGQTTVKVRSLDNPSVYVDVLIDVVDLASGLTSDVKYIEVYEGTEVPVVLNTKYPAEVYGELVWSFEDASHAPFDGRYSNWGNARLVNGSWVRDYETFSDADLIARYIPHDGVIKAQHAGYVEMVATATLPKYLKESVYYYLPDTYSVRIKVKVLAPAKEITIDSLNSQILRDLNEAKVRGNYPTAMTTNNEGKIIVEIPVGSRFLLHSVVGPDQAEDKTMYWSSSDPTTASVDPFGIVTTRKVTAPGQYVQIHASTKNGLNDYICVKIVENDSLYGIGTTIECRQPAYVRPDPTSRRLVYLKRGITFIVEEEVDGTDGSYYRIRFPVGDVEYAYVKTSAVEILQNALDTVSPIGMITMDYNAYTTDDIWAFLYTDEDVYDGDGVLTGTKRVINTADGYRLPKGMRVLVQANQEIDGFTYVSFGDQNSEYAYVRNGYLTTLSSTSRVTYELANGASIFDAVAVNPSTGAQVSSEEDLGYVSKAAYVCVSNADVYSGFEPATRLFMGKVYQGTRVTVTSEKIMSQYQIRLQNGTECWINAEYVSFIGKATGNDSTVATLDLPVMKLNKATTLRKAAKSTAAKVAALKKNQVVQVISAAGQYGNFSKIRTSKGLTGFVLTSTLKAYNFVADTDESEATIARVAAAAKMLSKAKTGSSVKASLKVGTTVIITGDKVGKFYPVKTLDGLKGYALASKLSVSEVKVIQPITTQNPKTIKAKVNAHVLHVRDLPTTVDSTVIGMLKSGDQVIIQYSVSNTETGAAEWYFVELPDGTFGYVNASYILLY